MKHIPPTGRRAFILIELSVVIAIIAILASILFPVFGANNAAGTDGKLPSGSSFQATFSRF